MYYWKIYCSDLKNTWTVWADTREEAEQKCRAFGHHPIGIYRNCPENCLHCNPLGKETQS